MCVGHNNCLNVPATPPNGVNASATAPTVCPLFPAPRAANPASPGTYRARRAAETRVRPSALREVAVEIPSVRWEDVGGLEVGPGAGGGSG